MKETEIDAMVATKLGCSPSYVQRVRLNPKEFDTELVKTILKERAMIKKALADTKARMMKAVA